jgi:hypothetical protein
MPSDDATKVPTSAEEWMSDGVEGLVIDLPSGKTVRCKRTMDMLTLLKAGKIPNPLAGVMQSMIDRGQTMPSMEDLDPGSIIEMLKMIDETVVDAVTEPKFIAPPQPTEEEDGDTYKARLKVWGSEMHEGRVPLTKLSLEDRMFIFAFAQGFAADLKTFREQQEDGMASMADVSKAQAKAKRPPRRK